MSTGNQELRQLGEKLQEMLKNKDELDKSLSLFWRVTTCLNWNKLGSHDVEVLGSSPSHLYAFEIGWREMKTPDEDYYDPGLGVPLLNKYDFFRRGIKNVTNCLIFISLMKIFARRWNWLSL